MHRSFTLALPADPVYRNLYALLLTITGAVPIDGILPDRCKQVIIKADPANVGSINLSDRNSANAAGIALAGAEGIAFGPHDGNVICLRDFTLQGKVAGVLTCSVDVTYK